MTEINWTKMNAQNVYDLYRALYSYKPITTQWQNRPVRLIEIQLSNNNNNKIDKIENHQSIIIPGSFEYDRSKKCIRIQCVNDNGQSIDVYKLAIEGKRIMTAEQFNNGFIKKIKLSKDLCFS